MVGSTLLHYQILEKLGEGGMGVVYKATDLRLLRDVAIKFLPQEFVLDEKARLRFVQEARAASALNHPGICTVHDIGEHEGKHFIVLEYIDGKTLRQILNERGRLPEKEVIDIGIQVSNALAVAHARGIIHRDIKPENIMVRSNGQVKVMDFGLAKLLDVEITSSSGGEISHIPLTVSSMVMTTFISLQGTAAYMAPEQIEKRTVDQRTDIFSMGTVLYELAGGIPPFTGATRVALMKSVLNDQPPPLEGKISSKTEHLILKALEKNPDARYQQLNDLSQALEKIQNRGPQPKKPSRAFYWSFTTGVLLIILFLLLVLRDPFSTGNKKNIISLQNLRSIGLRSEMEKFPSFSPDGKQIVYMSKKLTDITGFSKLWIKDLESGHSKPLSIPHQFKAEIEFPEWSPDGRQIVFASSGIWITDTTGQHLSQIVDFGSCPKWSPDGKQIAFSTYWSEVKNGAIFVYDFADSTFSKISPENGRKFTQPSWSIDGAWIACVANVGLKSEMWLIETGTWSAYPLLDLDNHIQYPTWSPDNELIYFISDKNGPRDLWYVRVDLVDKQLINSPTQITTSLHTDFMDISPSGDQIMFSVRNARQELWRVPLFKYPENAWQHAELLADRMNISNLDISPDGTKLALEEGDKELRIFSLSDHRESLLYAGQRAFSPSWSPDGKWIAFDAGGGDQADIWRIPASGGKAEKIVAHPGADWMPTFSPNGHYIGYVSNRGGSLDLWVENLETGEATQISNTKGEVSRGSWSHGSDKIAYIENFSGGAGFVVKIYDFSAKKNHDIIHVKNEEFNTWNRVVWKKDDQALYFSHAGKLHELNLATKSLNVILELLDEKIKIGYFAIYEDNVFFESTIDNYTLLRAEIPN
ncbi:protein kinase [candidate division KSB1 bacterium]|nr:protein kinase [candidate division KSB1 bacterium]